MGRFENENQMREMPSEQPKAGEQPRAAVYTNFLKKGAGLQKQQRLRKEWRARRGDELRGLAGREVLGAQRPMLGQFGAQAELGLGAQQQQFGSRGIESRLLSKPPLRHWGYEPAIVYQPDIDQAPSYKRHVKVRRERVQRRIHRVRRGVAWDIPVYHRARHEKGGLSWTIAMDSEFYADVKPRKESKSKSKSLLHRFTAGVKRVFKGRRATTKKAKYAVRPQQLLASRKRGEAFVARSQVPPQAPVVEKKRANRVERTTGADLSKQEAFTRAPAVVAAPVVEDRGMFVNGRRIHTTHMSEIPLMRQAPAVEDDKSAKISAPREHAAAPIAHTKGVAITSHHEQQLQHVRTG